jgi:hypothetical protein
MSIGAKVVTGALTLCILALLFKVVNMSATQQDMADELQRQEHTIALLSALVVNAPREATADSAAAILRSLFPQSMVKQLSDTVELDGVLMTFTTGRLTRVGPM